MVDGYGEEIITNQRKKTVQNNNDLGNIVSSLFYKLKNNRTVLIFPLVSIILAVQS